MTLFENVKADEKAFHPLSKCNKTLLLNSDADQGAFFAKVNYE